MTTRRAQFRRREEPIQFKIGHPVPFGLIFQFAEYFAESHIRNVLGKIVVYSHPGQVQTFDKDRLVLANDLRREFLARLRQAGLPKLHITRERAGKHLPKRAANQLPFFQRRPTLSPTSQWMFSA
jgi:hypothetical protein